MKIYKIDLENIKKENIEFIAKEFLAGKVIVYPTDTVYGLGCVATDEKAIKKIKKIKRRSKQKSFILLTKSFCMTRKFAKVSKKQDEFLRSVWVARTNSAELNERNGKNPTTIILQSREDMFPESVLKENSVALRLPKNDFLSKILVKVDTPIVSTSLNISGHKPLEIISDIKEYFGKDNLPDLVVDAGKNKNKKISKIIDIRDIDNVKKIR